VSTTDVLRDWVAGGAMAVDDTGGCTLLDGARCSAHPHRPLACRLYPLGRVVSGGKEVYAELVPDPATEGIYDVDGTVGGWLDTQGAGPYLKAHTLYLDLWRQLRDVAADVSAAEAARWLLDADAAITELAGEEPPADADEAALRHIQVVTARFLG
jgi:Fe-S-cluster containining protein